jgi:hypothetical protein
MGKYLVRHPVKIDGEKLFPSDDQVIYVEDRVARQHVKSGALAPFKVSSQPAGGDKPKLQDVVSAISKLSPNNDDHWTTSGKPQTGALSEIVGKAVSADLRNRAFTAWEKKKEASSVKTEGAEAKS